MGPLLKCSLFILLAFFSALVAVGAEGDGRLLHRQKREWISPSRKLQENHDYRGLASIAKIRSDKEEVAKVLYYISGPGADQDPVDRFRIDHETGFVRVYSILDREEIAFYHLKGVARFTNGTQAENFLDLNITVEDVNDNAPIIQVKQIGYVNESSATGTSVMTVIATDADDKNTDNAKISYSIVEQTNIGGMFMINAQTGEVSVRRNTLDREKQDIYKLAIKVCDLNGEPGGKTATGEIEIRILDINDNIPILEKETYEGRIEENTVGVEVMRIKATDMDVIHTDNWLAVYKIVSGNEGGYFSIVTDAKTNEGIIMVQKALDYEELKMLNLRVMVANKAEYNFGSASVTGASQFKTYPVTINVVNQNEGPRFHPSVKVVTVSEEYTSTSFSKIITNYAAIDTDTQKIATNVRYAKLKDIDSWLTIDERTADIRLIKVPDREYKYLKNGTYYAEIICITTDGSSKTATGTIAIQVEDHNDHCPRLTSQTHTMCLEDSVIYVTAIDEDLFPNSAPFEFTVIEESTKGKWRVEPFNETTTILREQGYLWPGIHSVTVKVSDQQGKSCAELQTMDVTVCTCDKSTKACASRMTSTANFGASGVLLLLLGLLLLLLVPLLLLFCLCGGTAALADFKAIPFDTKQQLISYHTEGQGEDKEIPLMHVPVELDGGAVNIKDINTFEGKGYFGGLTELGGAAGGKGTLGSGVHTSTWTADNMNLYNQYKYSTGLDNMELVNAGMMGGQDMSFSQYRGGAFDGMGLSEQFLWDYYSNKSDHAAQQSQVKDGMLVYKYEGQESPVGSVGCCSLLENDNDLAFLNDLGPKFKTLAEICQGSTLTTESARAGVSAPPVRPVSPIRPSTSTHTHFHTHKETVRDRDRVNFKTLNTANVSSGSSTVIQEEHITERAQSSATLPSVHVQDNIVIPSQTLLIQQPAMYYAAAPMYVVESKPQMMLVAGGAQQTVGQVGQAALSHGLVQVSGLPSSQGVVLVDRQGGIGEATGQAVQGLPQGTISRSRQVLVVENESTGGEQGVHLAQGFVQMGQGSAEQGFEVRSHRVPVKAQASSLGSRSPLGSLASNEDVKLTVTPKTQGSKRVVVQQKKVSVTERNFESSSRA